MGGLNAEALFRFALSLIYKSIFSMFDMMYKIIILINKHSTLILDVTEKKFLTLFCIV